MYTKMYHPAFMMVAAFYSLITFFLVPYYVVKTPSIAKQFKDPFMGAFCIGFLISMVLWHFVGAEYVLSKK